VVIFRALQDAARFRYVSPLQLLPSLHQDRSDLFLLATIDPARPSLFLTCYRLGHDPYSSLDR
jgi:hypothetical protein